VVKIIDLGVKIMLKMTEELCRETEKEKIEGSLREVMMGRLDMNSKGIEVEKTSARLIGIALKTEGKCRTNAIEMVGGRLREIVAIPCGVTKVIRGEQKEIMAAGTSEGTHVTIVITTIQEKDEGGGGMQMLTAGREETE